MKTLKTVFNTLLFCLIGMTSFAQSISVSGQLGYANPQGDAFKDALTGERLTSFGIGYDADVLYHLEATDSKLGVGLMYVGSVLLGSESASGLDIGLYGLGMYGVKGQYRLLSPDSKVSPYASLGLGLSQFVTPDITIGSGVDATTIEGASAFSVGIRPEIGLDLGGFLISAAYLLPMKYSIESDTGNFEGSAGSLTFSIGYRLNFDLSNLF